MSITRKFIFYKNKNLINPHPDSQMSISHRSNLKDSDQFEKSSPLQDSRTFGYLSPKSYYNSNDLKTSQLLMDARNANPNDEKTLALLLERVELLHSENKNLHDLICSFSKDKDSLQQKDLIILQLEAKRKAAELESQKQLQLINELHQDLENWKQHSVNSEKRLATMGESEMKLQNLMNDYERLLTVLKAKEEDIQRLNATIAEKIQELNSYRSQNMSSELKSKELVSENERLSRLLQEKDRSIDALRGERDQLFLRLKNFEGLDGEMGVLRRENQLLQEDNEKFNHVLALKIQELETLKLKHAQLESSYQEVNELRQRLEAKDLELARAYETIAAKEELINSLKKKEIERAEELHSKAELEGKLKLFLRENERLENELRLISAQFNELKVNNADLELKVGFIVQDNERMEKLVEEWKLQASGNTELKAKLEQMGSEISQLTQDKARLEQLVTELGQVREDLEREASTNQALQDKIEVGRIQNSHLFERIEELEKNVEFWKIRTIELEKQLADGSELESKVRVVIDENSRLELIIESKNAENALLQQRIEGLQSQVTESEHLKAAQAKLNTDISTLNTLLEQKNREVEQLRLIIRDQEMKLMESMELGRNVELLKSDNHRLSTLLNEKMKDCEALKADLKELEKRDLAINDLQMRLSLATSEKERLAAQVKDRMADLTSQQERIMFLESEVVKLNDLQNKLTLLATENQHLNLMLSEQQKETSALKLAHSEHIHDLHSKELELDAIRCQIEEAKKQFAHLSEQNQHLNLILSDKAEEVASLRSRYEGNEHRLLDTESMRKTLSILSEENNKLRNKIEEYERKSTVDIGHVVSENQRLNDLLTRYVRESETLRKELDASRLANLDTVKKGNLFSPQNDKQKQWSAENTMEISPWMNKTYRSEPVIQNAEEKLQIVVDENERLNKLLQEVTKEKDSWRSRCLAEAEVKTAIA